MEYWLSIDFGLTGLRRCLLFRCVHDYARGPLRHLNALVYGSVRRLPHHPNHLPIVLRLPPCILATAISGLWVTQLACFVPFAGVFVVEGRRLSFGALQLVHLRHPLPHLLRPTPQPFT